MTLDFAPEIFQQAPIGIFVTDERGRCVEVNARWSAITGLTREQALGFGWVGALHTADRDRVLSEWNAAVRAGRELVIEFRYQAGDRVTWVLGHAVALRDAAGRVVRYVGTAADITQRKSAEQALLRSETSLRTLFDHLPDPVIVHHFGPIAFANAAAEKALGYSLEELQALDAMDVLHPGEHETVQRRIELLRGTRASLNAPRMTRLVSRDGEVLLFEATAVQAEYAQKPAVIVLLHDVRARMAREAALRASLEGFTDAFFILDCERETTGEIVDFRIAELNDAVQRMIGQPRDVLAHGRLSQVLDPETFAALFPTYLRAAELTEVISQEIELPRFGTWVRHQVLPLPNGVVATFHDVTATRLAEARLRESEERWQFALEGSNQGVWDWNVETGTVVFSKRWKSMLGFEEHELPNRLEEWSNRVHPDDLPDVMRQVEAHFRRETPYYEAEHRVLCKNGSYLWILDRGCVMSWTTDGKPRRMVGTHTDISRSKQSEQLLRQSLEEKEVLLKEVHHRVKNNLQVTSSLLNLQATRVDDEATRVALREAQGRIHSIALLHERLYHEEDFAHVHLGDYTRILVGELERTLGSGRITVEIDAVELRVGIDVAMPYSLLLNELVTNAFKHAFRADGGRLVIELHEADGTAELTVQDDGVGLPPGFDPQTARSLGMTLVRLLSKQIDGTIAMRSDPGTTVTLRFPHQGHPADADPIESAPA